MAVKTLPLCVLLAHVLLGQKTVQLFRNKLWS